MHKITSVNLSGRAYQLEQPAYNELQTYLAQAQSKMVDDPDQEEVLQDFEQAIADKCDQFLTAHKNVITETEMHQIITAMGPVEVTHDATNDKTAPIHDPAPKRLYVLKESSVIGGVCTGLAAYLNVDVTVIRVVFVILAFATSGFWVLVYLIMLAVLPEAKTPEQKAELRGERFTAQDLLSRAKQKYGEISEDQPWKRAAQHTAPALSNTGNALLQLLRGFARICVIAVFILFGLLTACWATLLWMILLGNVELHDQLSTISHWTIAAGITAAYVLLLVPLWLTGYTLRRFARQTTTKASTPVVIAAIAAWTIAFTVIMCVAATTGNRIADYQRTHGYIHIWGNNDEDRVCINSVQCNQGSRRYHTFEQ